MICSINSRSGFPLRLLLQLIIMCGKISDRLALANFYSRSDLFLFPSLYDASSIVQIEAASQKLPTLFIEGAATTATVTNNVNGFIVPNDISEYANAIIKISNDNKLRKRVGENAFHDLYKNWDDRINEVEKAYLDLIEKKN